jgi:AraC-like DNA-binding protein
MIHNNLKMILYIKNMVCPRCKNEVRTELEMLGFSRSFVNIGQIRIHNGVSAVQLEQLSAALIKSGFELVERQKGILVRKLKNIISESVYYSNDQMKRDLPEYLSKKLNHSYEYLSKLFEEVEGTTIEKFFVACKIEYVKELLVYYKLNLTEISYQLNYDNISQLSSQFKDITGLSPHQFQKIRHIRQVAKE